MLITERKKDGIKYLELHGRIDGSDSNFEEELKDMILNQKRIVIDCAGMNFINSNGLRTFLMAVKTVNAEKGKIVICNLTPAIEDIFKISGFANIIPIFKTIEEAMENV